MACSTETYSTLKDHKEADANQGGTAGNSAVNATATSTGGGIAASSGPGTSGGQSGTATNGSAGSSSTGTGGIAVSTPSAGAGTTSTGVNVAHAGANNTGGLPATGGTTSTSGNAAGAGNNVAGSRATAGAAAGGAATGGTSATGGVATAGRSSTGGMGTAGAAGAAGVAGAAGAGPFPQESWCPKVIRGWVGCGGPNNGVCSELIQDYPYYLSNRQNKCAASSAPCASNSLATCPTPCLAPMLSDTIDSMSTSCDGKTGTWTNGCRGSGCTACVEKLVNYPNYFNNHRNCKPSCTCGDDGVTDFYPCSNNCPPPTDADR